MAIDSEFLSTIPCPLSIYKKDLLCAKHLYINTGWKESDFYLLAFQWRNSSLVWKSYMLYYADRWSAVYRNVFFFFNRSFFFFERRTNAIAIYQYMTVSCVHDGRTKIEKNWRSHSISFVKTLFSNREFFNIHSPSPPIPGNFIISDGMRARWWRTRIVCGQQ